MAEKRKTICKFIYKKRVSAAEWIILAVLEVCLSVTHGPQDCVLLQY